MGQIYCVECKKKVVDKEAICPHCCCPIDDTTAAAAGAKVGIPVESPVQRLKGLQLMSFITLCLSILVLLTTPREIGIGFWWVSGAAGLGCLGYASIRLWFKQE
jgi:hypothetical protein